MECTHPQPGGHFGAGESLDAPAHLACGLVGESQREDMPGVVAAVQQVHNLVGEDTRFAGPCSGDDQFGASEILDGGALRVVELTEVVGVHLN